MASSHVAAAVLATLCTIYAHAQYATMSPLPSISSRSGSTMTTPSTPQGKSPMTVGNTQSTYTAGPGNNFNPQGNAPVNSEMRTKPGSPSLGSIANPPMNAGSSDMTGKPPSNGPANTGTPTSGQPGQPMTLGTAEFGAKRRQNSMPGISTSSGQQPQSPPSGPGSGANFPMMGGPMNPRGQPGGKLYTMGGMNQPKSLEALSGMKPEMFTKVQSHPKPPISGSNGKPMMGPDGNPMTPFQMVLEKLRQNAKPEMAQCKGEKLSVDCGELSGIFFKFNEMPFQRANPRKLPMDVPQGGKLLIAVCGYGNKPYVVGQPFELPLVPTLVRHVGEKAYVSVHIQNSGNVFASGGFSLTSPSGAMTPNFLIAPSVFGSIGEDSVVSVNVAKSANVIFPEPPSFANIELKSASLLGPLIKPASPKCVEKSCISIDMKEAANIIGSQYVSEIKLAYSSLVATQFETKCIEKSTVNVALEQTGNFARSKSIELEANSFAINTVVKVDEVEASNIGVKSFGNANVLVKENAELTRIASMFQGGVSLKKSKDTRAMVNLALTANVFAKTVDIENARVISDVIEMPATKTGIVRAMVKGSGNILSEAVIMDSQARCIDDVLDLGEGIVGTLNQADLKYTCNVRSKHLFIKDESLLIETIIDASKPDSVAFGVELEGVANAQTGGVTKISKSGLLFKIVNIEDGMGPFKTKIDASYVANSMCKAGFGESILKIEDEAKLVFEMFSVGLETKEPNVVNAKIDLKYVGNAFIGIEGDKKKLVGKIFEQSSVGADKVMIDQKVVGKPLKCFMVNMPMGPPIDKRPMA